MKAGKWILIALLAYVGIVVLFESAIGYLQPQGDGTLVITTTDGDGSHPRVVSRLEVGDALYVAANHWPRAWYERALANPAVEIDIEGAVSQRRAVPVEGAEHERVNTEKGLPLFFKFLTGFPPRYFLRLDPVAAPS